MSRGTQTPERPTIRDLSRISTFLGLKNKRGPLIEDGDGYIPVDMNPEGHVDVMLSRSNLYELM